MPRLFDFLPRPATPSRVLSAVALMLGAPLATAQSADIRQDLTPVPVVRSFNLIGLGVGFFPKFSGSEDLRTLALPIIRADYKDTVYINALQAGAWLWKADDNSVRVGLAVEPRFGWKGSDAEQVNGMDTRKFSLEGGPNVQWRSSIGVFNFNLYQDLSNASDGQSAQAQFIRPVTLIQRMLPGLRVNGVVGVQWFSSKNSNYYFGVRPHEATPSRPEYTAGATTNLQLGLNGLYRVGPGSLLFGLIGNWLGNESANSPIVETRFQPVMYVAYGINF